MIEKLNCQDFILEKVNKDGLVLLLQGIEDNRNYMSEFFPWVNDFDLDKELTDSLDKWSADGKYNFCIMSKDSKECFGKLGIETIHRSKDANVYSLNYWVYEKHQGKGIASKAAEIVSEYLINEYNAKRVEIMAQTGNIKSMKVAKKANFIFEGIGHDFDYFDNKAVDAYYFVKLADSIKQEKLKNIEDDLKRLHSLDI